MKAAKNFIVYIAASAFLVACGSDKQTPQKLDSTTKDYFEVKNGSIYVFTEVGDTSISTVYTSESYINTQANPDIENNEIMTYNLVSPGNATYTIRCESGGAQFKDRIALITQKNDTLVVGPIVFNLGGTFTTGINSYDSAVYYPTYTINGRVFNNVVRVKPYQNIRYTEVFYAKNIGLIGRREKNNKFYYLKRERIIK
ncbi:MAG: hypothetical protein ACKOXF_08350 [Chitinophagaceae bacterium]